MLRYYAETLPSNLCAAQCRLVHKLPTQRGTEPHRLGGRCGGALIICRFFYVCIVVLQCLWSTLSFYNRLFSTL